MPVEGSYLIPRSMCSEMPKPKLPVAEKLRRSNSYSLTFSPASIRRHRLLAADRHGGRDLLVTPDRERAHRVARLAEDGLLARQLLEDLGGLLEPVAATRRRRC